MDDDYLQRAVGRNIRRLRDATGLSQEAFAESLGYQRNYIATLERGERNLTLRTVVLLAKQFRVTLAEIFARDRPDLTLSSVITHVGSRRPDGAQRL